jgi:hypothetical protein
MVKHLIRISVLALCVVSGASICALATPVRYPKSREPARPAQARPPRFLIVHTKDGAPGPLTSADGRLTLRLVGALEARVVEADTGRAVTRILRHSHRREQMRLHTWAFSPDGQMVATASSEGEGEDTVGEVRVWHLGSGKLLAHATDATHPLGRVHCLAFSADSRRVVVHCEDISGK